MVWAVLNEVSIPFDPLTSLSSPTSFPLFPLPYVFSLPPFFSSGISPLISSMGYREHCELLGGSGWCIVS